MSALHKTPQVTPASCPLSAPVSISSLRPQSDVKHYMCTSCIVEFGRRKIPVLLFNTHVSVLNLTSSYTFLLECAHRVHLFAVPWSVAHKGPLSMISPGKNTGMGSYFLLQGIVPAQGLNLSLLPLLHWKADSLPLYNLGSPSLHTWNYYIHFIDNETNDHLKYLYSSVNECQICLLVVTLGFKPR